MLIDAAFIIIMILAIFKGYRNGLILGAFSFLAIFIGLAAAIKLSAVVAARLHASTSISSTWLPFISFALIMLVVVILVRLGAKLIETAVETIFLGWLNKLAGIVLYAALYLIVFSVVLFYANKIQFLQPDTMAASKTYAFIEPWGPKVMDAFGTVIPLFEGMFKDLTDFFEKIARKGKA